MINLPRSLGFCTTLMSVSDKVSFLKFLAIFNSRRFLQCCLSSQPFVSLFKCESTFKSLVHDDSRVYSPPPSHLASGYRFDSRIKHHSVGYSSLYAIGYDLFYTWIHPFLFLSVYQGGAKTQRKQVSKERKNRCRILDTKSA